MMNDDNLRHIVEDHALTEDFLIHLSRNLQDGKPMPEHIPQLNDGLMGDVLSSILTNINNLLDKEK